MLGQSQTKISQTQPMDMMLSSCTQLLWSTMARPVLSGTCPVKPLYGLGQSAAAQFQGLASSGSQRRRSLSLPVLTLIFPALLPCLVRDSLCTALQTKILWINWSLNAIDTIETWVSGNLTALTERSQPAIRWRVGEVANRVSCGSFRGGH